MFYAFLNAAIGMTFSRSFPVAEHFHQIKQRHAIDAVGEMFRVVGVVRVVVGEDWL
jgi:hypothetical protein